MSQAGRPASEVKKRPLSKGAKGARLVASASEENPVGPPSVGKAALFDLDNTLYDAREYFRGAYRAVARYLRSRYGVDERLAHSQLLSTLESRTSSYPRVFDEALARLGVHSPDIPSILRVYDTYQGVLRPYSDTRPTLSKLKEKEWKLGVITDGDPERQKKKLSMLGLERVFDVVVFAKSIASKPSPEPYIRAIELLSADPSRSFYVGDNPFVDFRGAKLAGLRTIRLRRGEFVRVPDGGDVDREIKGLHEVLRLSEEFLAK